MHLDDMRPGDATRSLFRRWRKPRSAGPRRTERPAIDLDGLVDHGSNREVLEHALAARLAHLAPQRRIGDEPGDGVREGPTVLGRHEEPGLAPDHDVPVPRHVGGDDGQTRRHGLERRQRQPLLQRRRHVEVEEAVDPDGVAEESCEDDLML